MKKDTAIKKLTTYHSDMLAAAHKIRDLVESIDDDELTDTVIDWVEVVEDFLDEDGSIESLLESVGEVLSIAE